MGICASCFIEQAFFLVPNPKEKESKNVTMRWCVTCQDPWHFKKQQVQSHVKQALEHFRFNINPRYGRRLKIILASKEIRREAGGDGGSFGKPLLYLILSVFISLLKNESSINSSWGNIMLIAKCKLSSSSNLLNATIRHEDILKH